MSEQNFANHAKFVPAYHGYVLGTFLVNFGYSLYHLGKLGLSFDTVMYVLLSAAFIVLFFYARIFALTVQDRVIRLEERLRYVRLLPDDLKPRIGDFTVDQIVALRFASDAELPSLARRVLNEKLDDRKAIKQLVQNWKADHLRA